MTQSNYVLITILVCALCTQVTRWLPFLLFGGKKEVPGLVHTGPHNCLFCQETPPSTLRQQS